MFQVRILESVLRLEAQFSNLCEQLLTGNELQGELLRELKIYNKNRSERIKRKNLKICNKTLKSMPTNSICDQNDLAEDCVSTPVVSVCETHSKNSLYNTVAVFLGALFWRHDKTKPAGFGKIKYKRTFQTSHLIP